MASALSLSLAFQMPAIALAEDSSNADIAQNVSATSSNKQKQEQLRQQMRAAQETLANLGQAAEVAEYELVAVTAELNKTVEHIGELDKQIPETEAQLGSARDELATVVADSYKSGTPTLLDVLMDAASFDDFVTRVEYANRVSEYKSSVVSEVKDLNGQLNQQRADLEVEKANQEELVGQQQQRVAAMESAAAQAQAYYASLSSELQTMIAEEEAAQRRAAQEAARAQAAAAQQRAAQSSAAQQQSQPGSTQQESSQQGPAQQGAESQDAAQQEPAQTEPAQTEPAQTEPAQTESPSTSEEYGEAQDYGSSSSYDYSSTDSSYSTGFGSTDTSYSSSWISDAPSANASVSASADVNEFVSRAFSIIGASYQWSGYTWTGNALSSAFTCSGVVDFARGMPSRSSSPETLIAEVGSRLVYNTSDLKYGDLVFYACLGRAPGHVAIYIGNGQVIDSIPNGGVAIRAVDYMTPMGGGPIY